MNGIYGMEPPEREPRGNRMVEDEQNWNMEVEAVLALLIGQSVYSCQTVGQ